MSEIYNIYCDESCHLEHDKIPIMILGAVWCPMHSARTISEKIRALKVKNGLPPYFEAKWIKVSEAKANFYIDLVDYFFDENDLHFRGVLIPNKNILKHQAFDQTHDSWYYKMLFVMLEPIINPLCRYKVYLDIKDTRSEEKRKILEDVLRTSRHDNGGQIIQHVQQIRSHESEILQLADLLLGAVGYHTRTQIGDLKNEKKSSGKIKVIDRIQQWSGKSLTDTTWLCEPKFNLLVWHGNKKELL